MKKSSGSDGFFPQNPFQKGFWLSIEASLAVGILVIGAGALVFFTANSANHGTDDSFAFTRAAIQNQTRFLGGQAAQGPQPPANYYCTTLFEFDYSAATVNNRLKTKFSCEATP